MELFENLKNDWQNQSTQIPTDDGIKIISNKIKALKSKQRITNIVLLATVAILVFFFFYVAAYTQSTATWGLILMILPLLVRVIIELLSIKKLDKLNKGIDFKSFKIKLESYYKSRKQVHFVLTPVVFAVYVIGFIMLLPNFKQALSSGFYNYILVSSVVIILLLAFFIIKEIKKELLFLNELK
ncbi:hypothetical protein SAMN05428642_101717 [Flaviramulus basaltis]|uniref:Uncharacterized protein n=1 Tax=Flaviramulus basaltis TaxID=369401 RepID=A0A1K2ICR3_9FLAO|nr:hypothetical protein [Flaviramulus basaltis]SFZ90058.1 hypothetical protein SAMN05428642_101717 [Flaviramulus basaltis]